MSFWHILLYNQKTQLQNLLISCWREFESFYIKFNRVVKKLIYKWLVYSRDLKQASEINVNKAEKRQKEILRINQKICNNLRIHPLHFLYLMYQRSRCLAYIAWMAVDWMWRIGRITNDNTKQVLRAKPTPQLLCPPQILYPLMKTQYRQSSLSQFLIALSPHMQSQVFEEILYYSLFNICTKKKIPALTDFTPVKQIFSSRKWFQSASLQMQYQIIN